ncbi:Ribosomal-protein-S18p-alanine acetyltransferase [Pediococcus damnosus]|uniref:Ribosomal-protein-S18p-alanine acetyltransferase n=1 Tax=Pediococcus damnosus TaxID=51663 RepID=A0A0R2HBF3_9LACO|nr:ribosomal protein S18-alanine N-acetyltransferase [Pediococcus damnosus]AMV60061.1 Ribosomal-protein-S18p-alanine acetyltransferase [Pediococcus damnosus]AMV62602.1 Ribosomal-protein-S18p-alanine acetyltransferase [Pediococcus damnosus]AMV67519.1 Ribosomal-protein-S18p-alanine acetyltransferase [Pediococcus damnosus]AMV69129.1 Ribosomal-protein-S18p-alanine acetyltransferase [Pediococcus damnosus]KJU74757.1 alanine acetyltransferase [Pediococcus damnosus LMG 28219]
MLKEIKELIKNRLFNRTKRLREQAFEIHDHVVKIEADTYFIAKAMITDIPEILNVERSVYEGQTPWDRVAFSTELRRKFDRLYLVIRYHDRMLGFIGASFDDRTATAHITNIAVVPDKQNHGIGAYLLKTMIGKAEYIGYKKITLEVRKSNVRAQALYLKMGFEKNGVKAHYYFGDHEDAIDMTLTLGQKD